MISVPSFQFCLCMFREHIVGVSVLLVSSQKCVLCATMYNFVNHLYQHFIAILVNNKIILQQQNPEMRTHWPHYQYALWYSPKVSTGLIFDPPGPVASICAIPANRQTDWQMEGQKDGWTNTGCWVVWWALWIHKSVRLKIDHTGDAPILRTLSTIIVSGIIAHLDIYFVTHCRVQKDRW